MRRAAFIIVAAVLLAPQAFAGPWLKSLAEARKQAKAEKKLIFVDMFANWCGWCHRLEQEVFPSEAFQKATDDMILLRLNTEDRGEGTQMSQRFGVVSLPTALVLTHDLVIAGQIRGFAGSSEYAKMVGDVRRNYGAFLDRIAKEKTFNHEQRLDLARELSQRHAWKESESRLRKLLADRKAPESIRDAAYYELAVSLFMQQRNDEALKTLEAFAKLQNRGEAYERSRLLAGQILMTQGNFAAAHAELKKFKETFPKSPLLANVDALIPALEARMRQ
ncbi:MAG TPA: thioredoxin family protein [Thermoanaerobaculia bacterium]|nr:thioredoxin family protein [Thermoanaerobaculia bacterium]